jgi:hypothetical protein
MLYEIISPDAFLRPFIIDYGTLSAIYQIVRKAYTKTHRRRVRLQVRRKKLRPHVPFRSRVTDVSDHPDNGDHILSADHFHAQRIPTREVGFGKALVD